MMDVKGKKNVQTTAYLPSMEFTLCMCCIAEAVDKSLLGASFNQLHLDLDASPSQLGWLALFQSGATALSLPFWGLMSVRYPPAELLCTGCMIWGAATAAMALCTTFQAHCVLRAINGFGLCVVMPVSQAIIVNLVPAHRRGQAFGRLQAFGSMAGMVAAGYALSQQSVVQVVGGVVTHGWQRLYLQVAVVSVFLALMIRRYLNLPTLGEQGEGGQEYAVSEMFGTVRRIMTIPSFTLLMLQGMAGVVPWNAMSFVSFYFSARGFTDIQVGILAVVYGVGAAVGAVLGGYLGDTASGRFPSRGRILVALTSVCLGLPLYLTVLGIGPETGRLPHLLVFVVFCFPLTAVWAAAAACRPICAELVSGATERAQVVAWVTMMEGVSGSILGGPVVGALAERFGYRAQSLGRPSGLEDAFALGRALRGVGLVCWTFCAVVWVIMCFTFPKDRANAIGKEKESLEVVESRFGAC